MRRVSFLSLVVAAALLFSPLRAADRRTVVVADVHGAGAAFTSILQRAGIIDEQRRWSGGTAVLVQTGDVMDRGPDVRALLDFLVGLEREAAAAGGRVERLLGNHEVMNLVGHARDATPEIFAAWADRRSDARRERAFADAQRLAGGTLDKAAWLAAHPPGFVEYRAAFRPTGRYGRWLRSKPVVVQIEDTIFMHAGIAPANAPALDAINTRVRADLQAWDDGVRWLEQRQLILPFSTMPETIAAAEAELARITTPTDTKRSARDDERAVRLLRPVAAIGQSSLFKSDGPLWFRGYASWTDEEGAPLLAALLKQYNARRFVTGHTPQEDGRIRSRFDGGVYLIDTGMLGGRHFPGGRASALEIVGDKVTPIYGSEFRQESYRRRRLSRFGAGAPPQWARNCVMNACSSLAPTASGASARATVSAMW